MADQQQYVCESFDLATRLAAAVVQLLVLALLHNFVFYVLAGTLSTALGNLLISRRVGKQYPYQNKPMPFPKNELKKRNIFFDIKNYAVHKIAGGRLLWHRQYHHRDISWHQNRSALQQLLSDPVSGTADADCEAHPTDTSVCGQFD